MISPRKQVHQLMVGLMALPLTALPFVAYANLTPEGRLVRDRAIVALAPPTLPTLTPRAVDAAVTTAPRYEGAVMALAYHGIGSASDSEGGFVVSAKRFGEHLATMRAAGMNTVTAADVAAAFTGGPALPPNAVMLSFDDGRADAMMFADPLLKQAGMAATMFVISGAASEPGIYYASWDKIEGYAKSGRWDIQSHTATSHRDHDAAGGESLPALTSLAKGESLEEYRIRVREDLREAGDAIENHVGHRPVAFAYPFGAYGADRSNDPAIIDVLREEVASEYRIAFQQDDQDTVPVLTRDQDHLLLRRVEVENWSGLQLLQRIDRAARPGPWDGVVTPAPEELALPVGPLLPAPQEDAPSSATTQPGAAATPAAPARRAPTGAAA
ncbi:MAG: polysaccharide deacetylase family protein, partial [Acidimicrobiales bacterium]|nr:polysaccharide deacetylase family protein [Acidimicrobiales bacterium]